MPSSKSNNSVLFFPILICQINKFLSVPPSSKCPTSLPTGAYNSTTLCNTCLNFNSVAFITGAGSGIGQAVAHQLIRDGVLNLALVDITETNLEAAHASLTKLNSSAKILKLGADCAKVDQVEAAVERAAKEFGRLDVCFNAAGIAGQPGTIVEQSKENLENVLGLNLVGVWYCERAQIKQLLKQEEREVV